MKINAHQDNAFWKNRNRLESGQSARRPGKISMNYYAISKSSITMMSPYGGTIYVIVGEKVSFDVTIDGVIEMPYFIQGKYKILLLLAWMHLRIITGETTNEEFNEMMSSSKAPIIELEIPMAMIFTIPVTTVNEVIKDMTALADKWKEIMDNIQWMIGYKLLRPMRYITDVEISAGIL